MHVDHQPATGVGRRRTVLGFVALVAIGVAVTTIAIRYGAPPTKPMPTPDRERSDGPMPRAVATGPTDREPAREVIAAAANATHAVVRGTVRIASTHDPVTGGWVFARFVDRVARGKTIDELRGGDEEALWRWSDELRCAITASGRYELSLPAGAFLVQLEVQPPDDVEVQGSRSDVHFGAFVGREVAIGAGLDGDPFERDLEVDVGGRMTGVVLAAADGTPIAKALVTCWRSTNPFEPYGAYTDLAGTFLVTGLPTESLSEHEAWTVRASRRGYQPRELAASGRRDLLDITVSLERAVVLAGRVVDPSGHGVASARVDAVAVLDGEDELGRSLAYLRTLACDGDGAFAFDLPPAKRVSLRARGNFRVATAADAWSSGAVQLEGLDGQRSATELRLELQPHATFEVRATYPDGQAVPGPALSVLLQLADTRVRRPARFSAPPGTSHEIEVFAPPLPANDAIAFRGRTTCAAAAVADTPVVVEITLDPWQFPAAPPLAPIDDEQISRISLDVPGPHLRVVRDLRFLDDATGSVLGNEQVQLGLSGGAGSSGSCATSNHGRLRLSLGPGELDLQISIGGYRPRTVALRDLTCGHREIDVRMRRR